MPRVVPTDVFMAQVALMAMHHETQTPMAQLVHRFNDHGTPPTDMPAVAKMLLDVVSIDEFETEFEEDAERLEVYSKCLEKLRTSTDSSVLATALYAIVRVLCGPRSEDEPWSEYDLTWEIYTGEALDESWGKYVPLRERKVWKDPFGAFKAKYYFIRRLHAAFDDAFQWCQQ